MCAVFAALLALHLSKHKYIISQKIQLWKSHLNVFFKATNLGKCSDQVLQPIRFDFGKLLPFPCASKGSFIIWEAPMARENQTQPCLKAKLGCTYTDKKRMRSHERERKIKGERDKRAGVCRSEWDIRFFLMNTNLFPYRVSLTDTLPKQFVNKT